MPSQADMTSVRLDPIDIRILDAIQRDGRITKLALAEKVGLSPTPCWLRLRKLEKAGIVRGYHARVEPRAVAASNTRGWAHPRAWRLPFSGDGLIPWRCASQWQGMASSPGVAPPVRRKWPRPHRG